jgi:hypothetical protein
MAKMGNLEMAKWRKEERRNWEIAKTGKAKSGNCENRETPYALFPTPYSLLPTPYSLLLTGFSSL